MKISALKAFTIRDSETGNLTSIACGGIAEVSDTLGTSLISDGLAEAYILIAPTGSIEITSNGAVDVAEYAEASVNIADFKDFIGGTLTEVTASMLNGITSIRNYAFRSCTSLTSITIPEGVTSIGASAFSGCTLLTSITIPEGVTSIGNYAFSGCTSLTSITIPEGVTSVGANAFLDCTLLTSITIPEGVTSIGNYAFSGCRSLTSITIPEGVTSIGEYVFWGCTSLTSITIPEGVTSIGANAFLDCPIPNLTLPSTLQSIGSSAIRPSVECSLTMLSATPPDGIWRAINYNITAIYVPAEYVDVYKAGAGGYADIIHAIPT